MEAGGSYGLLEWDERQTLEKESDWIGDISPYTDTNTERNPIGSQWSSLMGAMDSVLSLMVKGYLVWGKFWECLTKAVSPHMRENDSKDLSSDIDIYQRARINHDNNNYHWHPYEPISDTENVVERYQCGQGDHPIQQTLQQ